jgi:cytochrome P450
LTLGGRAPTLAFASVLMTDFVARIEQHLSDWLGSPTVLRPLFAEARAISPVIVAGHGALVTSFAGVTEVLRDPAFGVKEVYAARMEATTGAFFLGMDPGPEYDRESSLARRAVRPGDIETVRSIARETAVALVEEARGAGAIDAVTDFTRVIPIRIVQRYFGVPGPDDATLKRWMRTIFWEIFLNVPENPAVKAAAVADSRELAPYLLGLIQARKQEQAAGTCGDDYLSRLVAQQSDPAGGLDDDGIRRNIGGIITGAVDTQSKAMSQVIEQLLKRPDALQIALGAIRDGDDALLARCVFEALRFDPINPILPRMCHVDHVLCEGTPHAKPIPSGTMVYAATLAATFDPDKVNDPDEFRPDRPADDYLQFGLGVHRCFGERFNDVVLPEAIKVILPLRNLRLEGPIKYEGPFPDHLPLRFDP